MLMIDLINLKSTFLIGYIHDTLIFTWEGWGLFWETQFIAVNIDHFDSVFLFFNMLHIENER